MERSLLFNCLRQFVHRSSNQFSFRPNPSVFSQTRLQQSRPLHSKPPENLIFRQLFHADSFTYTYLLGCSKTRNAVIIDPVYEMVERDIRYAEENDLNIIYGMNTHVHADHVTGTGLLKKELPKLKSIISRASGAESDQVFDDNEVIEFGEQKITCLSTPGHTSGCTTYVLHDHGMAFTGDTLLIRACGRTDFQQGCSNMLYNSVHSKIFSLPEHYRLYPGHDYRGFTSTTVGEEKRHNPRLTLSEENFVEFMKNLNLAYPKLIDVAVPSNLKCGKVSQEAVIGGDKILEKK